MNKSQNLLWRNISCTAFAFIVGSCIWNLVFTWCGRYIHVFTWIWHVKPWSLFERIYPDIWSRFESDLIWIIWKHICSRENDTQQPSSQDPPYVLQSVKCGFKIEPCFYFLSEDIKEILTLIIKNGRFPLDTTNQIFGNFYQPSVTHREYFEERICVEMAATLSGVCRKWNHHVI